MRILITEEALQSGKGHWPSYIGDLAGEFRHAGDDVDVLVHRDAVDDVVGKVGGTRWFRRNCWVETRSQGKVGGLVHNRYFFQDLKRWMKPRPAYDWVLALTMRLQHLLAFAVLSRAGWVPPGTRFLLLFVQGFGLYQGAGRPTSFPGGLSTRLARLAFRIMGPAVKSGRVVLAAETRGMQDELGRFTGLPVSLFPHPVHNRTDGLADVPVPGPLSGREGLTITCPGFARHEKGSDLLQDAILRIGQSEWGAGLRFVIQWPEALAMPDGSMKQRDERLLGDSPVEWRNENLNAVQYHALLDRSDFVILPYRSDSYHHRLSRVAIEAAGKGIPLIYTRHTWTREVAELAGGGTPILDESAEAVVEALKSAVGNAGFLKAEAKRGMERVKAFHSAETFRSRLAVGETNPV